VLRVSSTDVILASIASTKRRLSPVGPKRIVVRVCAWCARYRTSTVRTFYYWRVEDEEYTLDYVAPLDDDDDHRQRTVVDDLSLVVDVDQWLIVCRCCNKSTWTHELTPCTRTGCRYVTYWLTDWLCFFALVASVLARILS